MSSAHGTDLGEAEGPRAPPLKAIFAPATEGPWLFGWRLDTLAFGGSALLSLLLLGLGQALGILEAEVPDWAWIGCVLMIDVAHVWSTIFRVYLDKEEVARRKLLYLGTPALVYAGGAALYALFGAAGFWRAMAYLAVFHFVRQQYGWVVLYRKRAKESDPIDRFLDTAAIYAATIYPLIHWHAHLPRRFEWFVPGDFVAGASAELAAVLEPFYWFLLLAFVGRQVWRRIEGKPIVYGKVLVVLTTWLTWWVGIVALNGDYAFTVTNVIVHGLPYFVLTYRYGKTRGAERPGRLLGRILRGGVPAFLLVLVSLSFGEELLWDRLVWHDRPWLFGEGPELGAIALTLLVPLLAVPQVTHYVLDGWIWRARKENPELLAELGGEKQS